METEELKRAVEHQHHCKARLVQSVPVRETHGAETVWDGVVHVFKIYGSAKATVAYAWFSPIEGTTSQFFAVLDQGPVKSPVDAVRAAIVAEQRTAGRKGH